MSSFGVDVTMIGDKEVIKLFKELPEKVQKKFARESMRKEAKRLVEKVKAASPVLTGSKYRKGGSLKKSWKVKALRRSRKRIGVYVESGPREKLGIAANAPGYYPAHVELGTRTRAAKPFLRPVIRANRDSSQKRIGRLIGKAIEKEANAKLKK